MGQQDPWGLAGAVVFALRPLGASRCPHCAGTALPWWQHRAMGSAASPWAELSWDEQLPVDKGWQQPGRGDGAVGSDVPHVGQMLCGGQQVTLVWLWDQLSGHWYLGERLSPSLAFLTGIPHCKCVFCFLTLPFQPYFLNFHFDSSPSAAPQFLLEALQGNDACYTGPSVTFVLPVFPHLISRVLGTGAI